MRNNETGEFELVVGNKQLLSGFFIVVLLFAVAFAMGYVVGQNTQRPARLAAESAPTNIASNPADSRPQPASPITPPPAPTGPTGPDVASGQQPPPDSPPQPTTQPAQGSTPAVAEKLAAQPNGTGLVTPADLAPGSYWQVIAVKPGGVEAMRQTLEGKGFRVALTPGINGLTRVLVGPYSDNPTLGRAKTELETAGFQPVRYKP